MRTMFCIRVVITWAWLCVSLVAGDKMLWRRVMFKLSDKLLEKELTPDNFRLIESLRQKLVANNEDYDYSSSESEDISSGVNNRVKSYSSKEKGLDKNATFTVISITESPANKSGGINVMRVKLPTLTYFTEDETNPGDGYLRIDRRDATLDAIIKDDTFTRLLDSIALETDPDPNREQHFMSSASNEAFSRTHIKTGDGYINTNDFDVEEHLRKMSERKFSDSDTKKRVFHAKTVSADTYMQPIAKVIPYHNPLLVKLTPRRKRQTTIFKLYLTPQTIKRS